MTDPKPFKVNVEDLPWEDYGSLGRYGSTDRLVSDAIHAKRLDTCVTRLAPGKVSCPYHFHHMGEELFIVLEGTGSLRINGETLPLKPLDVFSCPPGPTGAHQITNDGDVPLVYFAISTVDEVELCEYPDSGKILAHAHNAGQPVSYVHRKADAVPYMDGETP